MSSTVAAMQLVTSVTTITTEVHAERDAAERALAAEEKKKSKQKAQIAKLTRVSEGLQEKINTLEELLGTLVKGCELPLPPSPGAFNPGLARAVCESLRAVFAGVHPSGCSCTAIVMCTRPFARKRSAP